LLVGVVGSALVLLINAAMSARSSAPARQLAEQSYVDQMLPAIQESSQEGRDIGIMRSQALSLSATTIAGRISGLSRQADQTLSSVSRLNPPASARTAHALLVASLAMRSEGVKALGQAIGTALSGQSINAGVQALGDVGLDLQAADRAYQLFARAMPPVGVAVPDSRWITNSDSYSSASLAVFVASLRSAGSLAPVHDVSVTLVTTDPPPVNVRADLQILPIAKLLNLQIVVADIGNQSEKNLTVSATITPAAIGPSQMVRDFVDLSPGQARTISLGGLRVQPSQPTTLTVHLDPAPGQADVADTSKVLNIQMQ
jgi:hypothetical protein